jgi:hypothetical protein
MNPWFVFLFLISYSIYFIIGNLRRYSFDLFGNLFLFLINICITLGYVMVIFWINCECECLWWFCLFCFFVSIVVICDLISILTIFFIFVNFCNYLCVLRLTNLTSLIFLERWMCPFKFILYFYYLWYTISKLWYIIWKIKITRILSPTYFQYTLTIILFFIL